MLQEEQKQAKLAPKVGEQNQVTTLSPCDDFLPVLHLT